VVSLNGSSTPGSGAIGTYKWLRGTTLLSTVANPQLTLNVGVHTLTFAVFDNNGLFAYDDVVITVRTP
jgi:hypothetical protein